MGKETVLFSGEERTGSQQAAAFLRQLADKIAARQMRCHPERSLWLISPMLRSP